MQDEPAKAGNGAGERPLLMECSRDEIKAAIAAVARSSIGVCVDHLDEGVLLDDAIGLDSLNRMTLVCELEERLGVEVWTGDIQELRSFGQLVDHVHKVLAAARIGGGGAGLK